ncbi:hypothetical protein AVEN_222881-1, partial [Araneus ventricosus]
FPDATAGRGEPDFLVAVGLACPVTYRISSDNIPGIQPGKPINVTNQRRGLLYIGGVGMIHLNGWAENWDVLPHHLRGIV